MRIATHNVNSIRTRADRVVDWLVRATGFKEPAFRPGDDARRETDFALGKKFVAEQFFSIAKALVK